MNLELHHKEKTLLRHFFKKWVTGESLSMLVGFCGKLVKLRRNFQNLVFGLKTKKDSYIGQIAVKLRHVNISR